MAGNIGGIEKSGDDIGGIKNEASVNSFVSSGSDADTALFDPILRPDDSYDADGTYWADLPLGQRVSFLLNYDLNVEAKREWQDLKEKTLAKPSYPFSKYLQSAIIAGAGLGLEGYVLFSIGNVKPLFQSVFKSCWSTFEICNQHWLSSIEYLEVAGIMVGQVSVGILGDWLGRRWGLMQDVIIMLLGLIMLTASWGTSLNGWVICYAWCLFIYGIGVGGEYPMTATSSMERTAVGRHSRLHRGRAVTSAFLMQGWGQLLNIVILIILLYASNQSSDPPYSEKSVQITFRLSFAIPAIGTAVLCWHRYYNTKHLNKALEKQKKKSSVTGYDVQSLKLTVTYFGGRLIATAGGWFANDIFFYGNKLFQSEFISVITPNNKSVITGWKWSLVNVVVSLAGYYMASFLIDSRLYGRKKMQIVGFMCDFILFVIPAFHFSYFTSDQGIHAFQALYFLSSFFNQFGPNSVTFIVAAEVYPAAVRASAHGFSAAVGKAGALTAAILYGYISIETIFLFAPWFGLAGAILTFVFLPDTTGLDLTEQERRWRYIRSGRGDEYCGVAIHPRHLSLWENWQGIGKKYNPENDYKMKVEEMRAEWMESLSQEFDKEDNHDEAFNENVVAYFRRTTSKLALEQVTEKKE